VADRYEKSWKHFAFKERNAKIRRLWEEGMKFNMICKRFGLSAGQVKTILKEGRDGQEAQIRLVSGILRGNCG
jgi:DNA invertase Pin-like site-specific DNA recombinase